MQERTMALRPKNSFEMWHSSYYVFGNDSNNQNLIEGETKGRKILVMLGTI
jgi:hypothetical protein